MIQSKNLENIFEEDDPLNSRLIEMEELLISNADFLEQDGGGDVDDDK